MRRLAVLIALLCSGCAWYANTPGSITYNRRMDRYAAVARRNADSLATVLTAERDTLYSCVSGYALARARSNATATEIADASLAACGEQFARIARTQDQWNLALVDEYPNASAEAAARIREEADTTRDQVLAGIKEQARTRAVRVVVDARSDG